MKTSRDKKPPFTFALSGSLSRPTTLSTTQACSGSLTIVVKAGKKTVLTKTVKLGKDCRWSLTLKFKSLRGLGKGKLAVSTKFAGNSRVLPLSAKSLTLQAG